MGGTLGNASSRTPGGIPTEWFWAWVAFIRCECSKKHSRRHKAQVALPHISSLSSEIFSYSYNSRCPTISNQPTTTRRPPSPSDPEAGSRRRGETETGFVTSERTPEDTNPSTSARRLPVEVGLLLCVVKGTINPQHTTPAHLEPPPMRMITATAHTHTCRMRHPPCYVLWPLGAAARRLSLITPPPIHFSYSPPAGPSPPPPSAPASSGDPRWRLFPAAPERFFFFLASATFPK